MAQLKDTIITGDASITGTLYPAKIQGNTLWIPTSSGGTTYGAGTSGQVLKTNGTTVYWATDSNSDTKVTQTATTTSANYEVLFSETADNTTRTEGARKNNNLLFNPSTGNLQATQLNGVAIGSSPKFTDNNTTYALSGALSSHKFTSTLTASGSGSGTSTSDLTLAAGTGITLTDDTSNRKITIACSVTNTDYRVNVVETNPSSSTDYYPTWHTATSGNNVTLCANDGIKYQTKQGTTSAAGTSVLLLGNNKASGTEGNKYGQIYLYGTTAYAVSLYAGSPTATRVLTLPDATGTVALTSHTHGNITSGGALQSSDITIANGDKLVVTDSSDSNKVARASISFDGSTTTQCLTKKGTWASFTNNAGTITGSGTSGYIAKWNGGSSITNGPQFGSDSAKYLRNDGTWAVPPGEGGMAEDLTELTGVTSLSVLETKLNEVLGTMPDSGAAKKVRGIYVDSTITTSPFATGTYEGLLFKQANVAAGGGACILWTTGLQSTQTMIVGHKSGGTWGNWKSYINTDTKVSTAAVTSGTTYYPVVGADTTSAATKFYDKTGLVYKGTNGTTSTVGTAILTLGNSTASGTANNKQGQLILYGSTAYATTITPGAPTAARTITLPNASGTVSLDGHTHVVALNNGQLTSTYKFFIIEYQDRYAWGIKNTCVMPNNGDGMVFSYITQIPDYSAHYFVTFEASISSNTLTFANATGTWITSGGVGSYESVTPPTITAIWGVK